MQLQFDCHHKPQVWISLLNSHLFRFNIVMKGNMYGKQRKISERKTSMYGLQYSPSVFSCWSRYKANCVVFYSNFIMQLHFFYQRYFRTERKVFFYFEFQFNIEQILHCNGKKSSNAQKHGIQMKKKKEWMHIKTRTKLL